MSTYYFRLILVGLLLTWSCSEDEQILEVEDEFISISDKDIFTKALIIPGKKVIDGDIPSSSTGMGHIRIHNSTTTQNTSNGSTTALTFYSQDPISGVYIKIVGSESYLKIPANRNSQGIITIQMTIPSNVLAGSFSIKYYAYNDSGVVSNALQMNFNVPRFAVGVLQISLTWNSVVDMGMNVTEPLGGILGNEQKDASSGGFYIHKGYDDEGFGPEIIYWENKLPDGEYKLNAQLNLPGFVTATDFYVTVSKDNSTKIFKGTVDRTKMETYVMTFKVDGERIQF